MSNWNIVRRKVDGMKYPSDQSNQWKYKSQSQALKNIINKAEEWHLPSDQAEKSTISNLAEIIVEANKAIANNDKGRLTELFLFANECKNAELRLTLRGDKLPELHVKIVNDDDGKHYILDLTKKQYNRMEFVLRNRFRLQFDEE